MEETLKGLYLNYEAIRDLRKKLEKDIRVLKQDDVDNVEAIKLLGMYLNSAHDEDRALTEYIKHRDEYIKSGKDITAVFEE